MKIRSALVAVTAAAAIFALAGCTPAGGGTTTEVDAGVAAEIDAALAEITGTVLSTGPNGEEPSSVDTSVVTDEQAAEIAGMGLKAAIVMHYGGNDWANAQIDGLNSEFKRLGIQVIATTDADFDPATQVSQIETVLTQDPDIIVSIPTDPVATASGHG